MNPAADIAEQMEKARRALRAAHLLLANSDTEGLCNRAYYAMFHAAHAALWAAGVQAPGSILKTHVGLISLFGQELVKSGKIDTQQGRALSQVHKMRLLADYTSDPPIEADAKEAVELAEAFVEAVQVNFLEPPYAGKRQVPI